MSVRLMWFTSREPGVGPPEGCVIDWKSVHGVQESVLPDGFDTGGNPVPCSCQVCVT